MPRTASTDYPPSDNPLIEAVRAACRKADVGATELARQAGITPPAAYRLLTGPGSVDADTLAAAYKALRLRVR